MLEGERVLLGQHDGPVHARAAQEALWRLGQAARGHLGCHRSVYAHPAGSLRRSRLDMSAVSDQARGKERLLKELLERVADRLPPDRAEVVSTFARMYARRLPADAALTFTAEELFGQVMGAFELADGRGTEPIAVRAFNPTLAWDGYTSVGT